ncbi:MAG: B12-binding domain-containing radical SAM protein [Lentisphaerae bacterium]|nr:B12-binding domain-containing radical SAM protein [Lentisphaerota bacterium]
MTRPKLALARVNYSQLYKVYDGGKTYKQRDILTPYQLLNLAGTAREQGAEAAIFDGEPDLLTEEALAKRILDWRPDFVGFTSTTPDIEQTLEACRFVKEGDASIVTILGGVHATVLPEDVARHSCVDYVVAGDGEEPLARIMAQAKGRGGAGTSRAAGDTMPLAKIVRPQGPFDLSKQPMPAHDLLDYRDYPFTDLTRGRMNTASVMSSRGCPFSCSFCARTPGVRYRDAGEFVAEIEYLYREKGVRYFFVYDDVFVMKRARVLSILEHLRRLNLSDAHFQCQARANLLDEELLAALRATNFVRVSIGIESGSEAMLERCNKGVTKPHCRTACTLIRAAGMEPRASFIIGFPYETRATAEATIAFSQELDLLHANFTVMTPYPGTIVYDMACRQEGLRFVKPEYAREWSVFRRWGEPIVETDELSSRDLEALRERAVTEFYTQDKVFRYYESLFRGGNRSRYFYRPLNFAWQRKFGRDIPFWDHLDATELIEAHS